MKRYQLADYDTDTPGMIIFKLVAIVVLGLILLYLLGYWKDIWNLF